MGKGESKRSKALFWKISAPWPAHPSKPDHWVSYAVVLDQWKLCTSRNFDHMELFNLITDPLEKNDVSNKEKSVVKKLKKELDDWLASLPEKPTGNVFSSLRDK
jgi:N-acetylgalactosamine-6-sulfatase